jgi:hypothetical protein
LSHISNWIKIDSNMMNSTMLMLSDEVQLGYALEAFGYAHQMGVGWTTPTLLYLKNAGFNSMSDLATGCKDSTVNLDLELFGTPPDYFLSQTTIQYLKSFLPGPRGFRCFRLAQRIAQKVEKGSAVTEYVHREESGKSGDEEWHVPVDGQWVVNVDCAGFVRHSLKHVTKNPFVMALSDRDFMRAKDFYDFFSTLPFTVMDAQEIPDSARLMKWRTVPDLRMVIPGDVIVYRPRGNAAGGAVFIANDRKDLIHMLKAVKTAQVWTETRSSGALVTRNISKDPQVRAWVTTVKNKLKAIGIHTIKAFYQNIDTINDKLKSGGFTPLRSDSLKLMRECCESSAANTVSPTLFCCCLVFKFWCMVTNSLSTNRQGHILFAAGPAQRKGGNAYRIRVVHSTKFGKLDQAGQVTTGVQEYYKRFTLKVDDEGKPYWTREMHGVEPNPLLSMPAIENVDEDDDDDQSDDDIEVSDDDIPNPNDDFEQEEEAAEEDSIANNSAGDDLAGQSHVEVIAARMCF